MLQRFLLVCVLAFAPVAGAAPTIMVLGDSLSAAYGFAEEAGWVSLLERRLPEQGYPHEVANASISGETTAGGLSRLPRALTRHEPEIVIVALGGNDGLRGLAPGESKANLARIIERAQEHEARVLLAGIRLPPNYGAFAARFEAIYEQLAEEHEVPLLPFMLEDIATEPELMQDDGIHPTRQAQPLILDLIWPKLEALLDRDAAAA